MTPNCDQRGCELDRTGGCARARSVDGRSHAEARAGGAGLTLPSPIFLPTRKLVPTTPTEPEEDECGAVDDAATWWLADRSAIRPSNGAASSDESTDERRTGEWVRRYE